MPLKVLIVGGVAGGASAAARLRRLDETAEIIVFEKGEYISYANCGLPYYIGEVIKKKERLIVQTPENMRKRFNIDIRVNSEVISIDRKSKTVEVLDRSNNRIYTESYDRLILSPGAEPVKPRLGGVDSQRVFTLRDIPDTYRIKDFIDNSRPENAVIVGAGFIGLEMAENLHERGIRVTIVELSDHVMGPLDPDMAAFVHQYLRSKGISLYLKNGVSEFVPDGERIGVKLSDGRLLPADMVILAVGVRPNVKLAAAAGLKLGKSGGIAVDEFMQTSDPDIYAVGDAVEVQDFMGTVLKNVATGGRAASGEKAAAVDEASDNAATMRAEPGKEPGTEPGTEPVRTVLVPLAGPANKQGRIAADNICGRNVKYNGTQGTSIVKLFDMTVAQTGLNEKRLKEMGADYEKSFTYSLSHAGYYPGSTPMTIKLLFEKTDGTILGAQIVGYDGVDKRIDVIATAIRAGMTVFDLQELELSYAPPFSSAKDPVNIAGFVASNLLKGDVSIYHWDEIGDLDRTRALLLDVRTKAEFSLGTINGAVNIPLDELRERIGELPADKSIYVFCQVGLRGYIAARMLMGRGFASVKNLNGGYLVYNTIIQDKLASELMGADPAEGTGESESAGGMSFSGAAGRTEARSGDAENAGAGNGEKRAAVAETTDCGKPVDLED
ncbi:MAG: FAD-dependent oxidoreductase [Clostridiaceae bacterium]|jgi:NADPH-dependent 2,4-dienoyl-CoA reductase/sulfur reductase-like enzyme/rhodanese-related sulfurtransferase|nr:FAD-dependent oxidoreductase [Clostridiaceae bacterium]